MTAALTKLLNGVIEIKEENYEWNTSNLPNLPVRTGVKQQNLTLYIPAMVAIKVTWKGRTVNRYLGNGASLIGLWSESCQTSILELQFEELPWITQ